MVGTLRSNPLNRTLVSPQSAFIGGSSPCVLASDDEEGRHGWKDAPRNRCARSCAGRDPDPGRTCGRNLGDVPGHVSGARTADHSGRLNFVFILSDDERVQGNAVMKNVQQMLAAHGVTFTNFNVTTSECGPSRASILSGQYSHHTGVKDNFGPHGYPAFDSSSDLATWLHQDGYETALVGKYLNDYSLDGHNAIPPGWNDWQAMDSVPLEKYYDYNVNENGRIVHYGDKPADYSTSVLTNRALAFLRSARKPFFLYFAPVAPHLPAIPAPQDIGALTKLPTFRSPALNQRNISSYPWASYHSRSLTKAGVSYTDE